VSSIDRFFAGRPPAFSAWLIQKRNRCLYPTAFAA